MVVCDADVLTVVLSALGDNLNDTVGTLVTKECHGSGILQDGHMIHFLWTYCGDIALHTIDEDKRCTGAQALQSSDVESRILLEIGTSTLERDESVALSEN